MKKLLILLSLLLCGLYAQAEADSKHNYINLQLGTIYPWEFIGKTPAPIPTIGYGRYLTNSSCIRHQILLLTDTLTYKLYLV